VLNGVTRVKTIFKFAFEAGRLGRTPIYWRAFKPPSRSIMEMINDDERTAADPTTDCFENIEAFDNRARRHSALGYVAPAEYERAHNQNHC
jgi:hypothetical protein